MMKVGGYSLHGVEEVLRMRIKQIGSQYQFATLHHLSPQYVNDVLHHRRLPGPAMLKALQLEARTLYYPTIPIRDFIRGLQP